MIPHMLSVQGLSRGFAYKWDIATGGLDTERGSIIISITIIITTVIIAVIVINALFIIITIIIVVIIIIIFII